MKILRFLFFPVCFLALSCNTVPPAHPQDLSGIYYPSGKKGKVDSSEVLRVTGLDSNSYVFRIAEKSGVGTFKEGIVSGELSGPAIGTVPFTFARTEEGSYEFSAMRNKVELVRLGDER